MSRDFCVALPPGAMGLSAVCDCGISYPCSKTFFFVADQLMSIYISIILQSMLATIVYMSFSKFMG